jgi:hypothetical protein
VVSGVKGGVSLVCGFCTEHEKADADTAGLKVRACPLVGERERGEAETEATEYRCGICWRTGL